MIDIEKFTARINALKSGKTLIFSHYIFGKHSVKMNQQQNRIFAEPLDDDAITHREGCTVVSKQGTVHYTNWYAPSNIEHHMLWDHGDWSIMIKEPTVEYIKVESEGVYEKI